VAVQPACSNAPPPSPAQTEPGKVITKIHTRDGTLYVTSRYAVTDSFVVIEEILRGEKYYPDPGEAHLYNKPEAVKQPAKDLVLPLRIPANQVEFMEPWKASHKTRNGLIIGGVIVGGLVAALIITADSVTNPTFVPLGR
jgi:hypothetical protein